MYTTLHGAFGTWPSEPSFTIEPTTNEVRTSGINETFDFESENPSESPRPVFTFKSVDKPTGKVFIPPFFVPPGAVHDGSDARRTASSSQLGSNLARGLGPGRKSQRADEPLASQGREMEPPTYQVPHTGASITRAESDLNDMDLPGEPDSNGSGNEDIIPRPPSPISSPELEGERAELWSADARKAFHDMVTAPGYINRYRLHMKKRERMMQYLQNPDREPMLCDGSRDHQTKYQAAHWIVMNGKLYRKPESGRVARFRRHLDDFEAWDVLTIEHIRCGHLGRDKLRKVLEQNYIGYTLQEIMFILKECKKCAGRASTAERKDLSHDIHMMDVAEINDASDIAAQPADIAQPPVRPPSKGPYSRQQTSNLMWF